MSKTRQSSVNFGSGAGGLSTVGFTLYNFDGTVKTARTTTNVNEIGSSTGIYASSFTADDDWDGLIVWDTGESSPIYAQDEKYSSTAAIQDETAKIRVIWNTLKNRADFEAQILQKLAGIKDDMNNDNVEVLELTMKNSMEDMSSTLVKSVTEGLSGIEKPDMGCIKDQQHELLVSMTNLNKSLETALHKINNISKEVPMKYTSSIREILKTNKEFADKIDKTQFESMRRLEGINIQYNKLLSNIQKSEVVELINALKDMDINIKELENFKELLSCLVDSLNIVSNDMNLSASTVMSSKLADPNFIPMLIGVK